jgi:hypothetical protein
VRIVLAIAAYERTLVSDQSPFDRYLAGTGTLTSAQQYGLARFQTLCVACHADLDAAVLATGPVLNDFRNIGVRPAAEDPGRQSVTGDPLDRGRFRVPGLRNVELRSPYFHNGSMATLGEVIDFYARGGDFTDNQDPLVGAITGHIAQIDRFGLEELLLALTDPRVQNEQPPFDRPRLWSEGPLAPIVFGTGTAGGGLPPRSAVAGPAFLGNPRFALGVDRIVPGAFAGLLIDVAASATSAQVLGHSVYLGLTPALFAVALRGPTASSPSGSGYTSLPVPVPRAAALAGTYYGQWVVFDPAGPAGFVSSDAFGFTVF